MKAQLKERSAAQEPFVDLCRLIDHPTTAEADSTGAMFCSQFNHVAVDRELRMIRSTKSVNELFARIGRPSRYPLDFDHGPEPSPELAKTQS